MNDVPFYALAFFSGLAGGAICFIVGHAFGRISGMKAARPKARFGGLPFVLPAGDAAARRAVEGDDDFDPDAHARWPMSPWMGG